jgi:DNA-binding winged helix-turn-helix (wHTH) protein
VRNVEDLPTLVAQAGPLDGQRWMLRDNVTIGRDHTCEIIIPSRQVSRFHARITNTTDGSHIEDLGSKNGTHCNGEMIAKPTNLQDGDLVQIALAQQFIFLSSDATLPLDVGFTEEYEVTPTQEGLLHLDKRSRRVWIEEREIIPPLSVSQFELLELLYENQGRVVPRVECIRKVWGEENAVDVSDQALDALIRRLRDRLAAIDPTHAYVVTVRGHGLRLDNLTIND